MKVFSIDRVGLYSGLFFFTLLLQTAQAQQSCKSPGFADGLCVPHNQCNFITRTVNRYGVYNLPTAFVDYVAKLRCAGTSETGQYLYCCENQFLAFQPTKKPTRKPTRAPARPPAGGDRDSKLNPNGLAILNRQKCGNNNKGIRLSYGKEVDLAEFPWMALLRYDTNGKNDRAFKCAGTLITDRYVLSAAHCVVGVEFNLVSVRLGEHNLDTDQDCQRAGRKFFCTPPVEDYGIESTVTHPDYSSARVINDVMLIKLDRAVTFKEHIRPICLPTTQRVVEESGDIDYILAGWGTTERGYASSVLLKAVIPHKARDFCQNIFKLTTFTDAHICAGGAQRINSCQGDSGGPLFFVGPYQGTQRYVQYGIVSFGYFECGSDKNYPAVFANVVHFMPWITATID